MVLNGTINSTINRTSCPVFRLIVFVCSVVLSWSFGKGCRELGTVYAGTALPGHVLLRPHRPSHTIQPRGSVLNITHQMPVFVMCYVNAESMILCFC